MKRPISHLGAICFAIAGFTCWVLCDSMIKLAGRSQLPNYEIVAFLGIFIAVFVAAYAVIRGESRNLWPKRPGVLLVRATLDVGNNMFVVIALRHLTLTLFYIIIFMSPMVVAMLSRVFLKERLDGRKVAAIMVGFSGVVVAVDPFRSLDQGSWVGYAACAMCVLCFSAAIVWSRVISRTEKPESMVFVSGVVTASVGLVGMMAYAAPLNSRLMAVLGAMGLLCALGNICIFVALKHTTAATVSQYHYTQLVSGAMVAYLMFGEKPTRWMLMGALLIIGAGLYIALRGKQVDGGGV